MKADSFYQKEGYLLMKDLLDVHMHTLASGHAYSTPREMVAAGRRKGLQLIGMSEHAPHMPGTCNEFYFCNFKVIRPEKPGIEIIMGAELNIIDFSGSTDLSENMLKRLDYAIASLHEPCIEYGTKEQHTAAMIGAMRSPHVKIIGHPDNGCYPVDYEAIVKAAKEYHVLLEINNSSYDPRSSRIHSRENALEMLRLCKKYEVSVIMDSDAHIDLDVGSHERSLEVIAAADFPEELVVNTDVAKFKAFLA